MPDSSIPEIGPEIVEQMRRTLKPVVRVDELRQHFRAHRREWGLPSAMRFSSFLESLLRNGGYTEVQLHSSVYAPMKRYAYSEPNPYVLGCALREDSYLSHGSALALHNLSSPSTTIYVNKEQSAKPRPDAVLRSVPCSRRWSSTGRPSCAARERSRGTGTRPRVAHSRGRTGSARSTRIASSARTPMSEVGLRCSRRFGAATQETS